MTDTLDPPEGHVELGSAADAPEGHSIAIQHVMDSAGGGHGLPGTATQHADDAIDAPDGASFMTKAKLALANFALLRKTPYGLSPVMVLGLISFAGAFERQAFGIARPFIIRELEIDIGDLITLQIYAGIVLTFGALMVGWSADRLPRVPFVWIGTVLSGLLASVSGFARSFAGLAAPRLINDSADLVGGIPRFSLLADYYPVEARGRVFAALATLSRIGALGSALFVGFAIDIWGWRTALVMLSLPLILMGVVAKFTLKEPTRGYMERKALGATEEVALTEDEPQSFAEGWRATWAVRTLRRLFVADAFANGGDAIFGFFSSLFLVERYGLSASQLSLIGIPIILAAIVGGTIGGNLVDRLIRRDPGRVLTVIGSFHFITMFGIIGFALAPPIWMLVAFNTVFAFGAAMVGPASSVVYTQIVPPAIRTQGLQVTALAGLPTTILVFPLGGTVFALYGYETTFLFCVPFLFLSGIIAMTAGSTFELDARSAAAQSLAAQEWRNAKDEGRAKLLVCRDIDVSYDGVQVLFGVDFDVEEGQIIALLGTNGAGKSTLLRAIAGLTEAGGGAVVFDGRDITHMPPYEIAKRGVVHMPGGRGVFPGMTVRDNLEMALWMVDDVDERRNRLAEVFEIFPKLAERANAEASVMSGGEQQQLSLAQAFLAKPRLLCIDELSLGLSPAIVGQLLEIVREIHRRGVTIVVVEQSVNVALSLAEKAIFMEKGEVRFFGDTEELINRPDILRAVYVKGSGSLSGGGAGSKRGARERQRLGLDQARNVLEVNSVSKSYGGVQAVKDVSFDLRDGEILGLIGPNGAGKTTVLELIGGYQKIDSGKVILQGTDVTDMSAEERARMGLLRRFQDAKLFPSLTVYETMLVTLEKHLEVKSTALAALGVPRSRRAERRLAHKADELIELLDLGAFRDKFVRELSTGLRRIVDLACVLGADPDVLLLDEPSSGIAQAETEMLGPLFRRVQYESGCAIIIVEHDIPLISSVSDELIAFELGEIVVRGTPDVVLNNERVIESYLGDDLAAIKRSGRK